MLHPSDPATEDASHDVLIAGGGLAGLCLAIQLKRAEPQLSVAVFDRREHPAPPCAHKIGESSVEVGSHYFQQVLGLDSLLAEELPKFGLRFFFSSDDNRDIAQRFELGPHHFLSVPSFQIDRGRFENGLVDRCRELGVELSFEARVEDIELGTGGALHQMRVVDADTERTLRAPWLVDAAGRANLLKRKLGLTRRSPHDVNSAWFRLDHRIDVDDWSEDADYGSRCGEGRWLSTNHLLGDGYWIWLIPLGGDRTSIGLVVDQSAHPFSDIHRFDLLMSWFAEHEPQLAASIAPHLDKKMDFLVLKHFSHACKQVFSPDRWCISGEAGFFGDPFYSPGSDFIAMSNSFVSDLILRERAGEDVSELCGAHERTYASIYSTVMTIYQKQYPIMGNARVMSLKILWDFTMYWGGIALLFNHGKICDREFSERAQDTMAAFAGLGFGMQRFLRRWDELDSSRTSRPTGFIDYSSIDFLGALNAKLLEPAGDDALLTQLEDNLRLARELDQEIRAFGARVQPELAGSLTPEPPQTRRLGPIFELLFGDVQRLTDSDARLPKLPKIRL